ncbi:MAG: hypothetical protein Tsb0034_28920 [Ekhidna sp.]
MKNRLTILFLMAAFMAGAQGFNEKITIPLSSPGKKGKLEVGLVRGDIKIEVYNGKEVIIQATAGKGDCHDCDDDHGKPAPAGMKKISSSPIELEASEENNRVEIETNSWQKPINLDIKLPSNFDLNISTVHGNVTVKGISGTHEISSVNGPIKLTDIGGSVVSNTVNGDIIANFTTVNANEPMSFVTLNGDVDITFPASIKAKAKMRSERGEIYTDFDMTVDSSKPEVKSGDGEYKVSINSWVYGNINGGGPEYTFKNMQGNIIIRKK